MITADTLRRLRALHEQNTDALAVFMAASPGQASYDADKACKQTETEYSDALDVHLPDLLAAADVLLQITALRERIAETLRRNNDGYTISVLDDDPENCYECNRTHGTAPHADYCPWRQLADLLALLPVPSASPEER